MPLKTRLGPGAEPLFLVDGSAFIHRAFHASPEMTRSDGFPTNALFTVLRLLLKLLREEDPRYLVFYLDGRGPTFRRDLYAPYKAQRTAAPEPLVAQIEPIKQGLGLLGLSVEVSAGCEADDCIASLAARFKSERPVVIVGADKDLRQCLDRNVVLWDPQAKGEQVLTLEDFRRRTGLAPSQWPDFQALTGDASDNIPGVPGVGPKTAARVLERLPSLEAIRDGLDQLTPAERAKIEPHLDAAFLYRQLTTLRTDVCPQAALERLARRPPDQTALAAFFQSYEFRSLLRELPRPESPAGQLPLFETPPAAPAVEVRRIASAGELPDLTGRTVGLVPQDDALALGCDGESWLLTGDEAALPPLLAKAGRVFCPDVKALLGRGDAWARADLGVWFDLGLAAYLLNPEERDYSWDRLSAGMPAAASGPAAIEIGRRLEAELAGHDLLPLLREMEMPLIPVLARMETRGVGIDLAAFALFLDEVRREIDRLTKRIFEQTGGPFNLRSSRQLGEALFVRLGLAPAGKTPGGEASTSQEVLEKLAAKHPAVEDILEFRRLEKLRSTYLEPLPRLVDQAGRLHTTFNQTATATGRLSSSNPNLQNIPIRGDQGRRMRACFVPAQGNLLVAADYSQIELRVLAHLSQDPTLVEAFRRNEDIHSRTASLLFDRPAAEITPDQRRNAKTINFGLIYGMGPQRLAQELKIPMSEAKGFIERYFSRLTTLRRFYEEVEARARELGHVTTMAGRRRLLPDIRSQNAQLQTTARRQAINTVVQGSAADIIKLAMLKADADPTLGRLGARLILQVHDELLLESPERTAREAGERLAAIMAGVRPAGIGLTVPLAVDWGVGRTWAEAH